MDEGGAKTGAGEPAGAGGPPPVGQGDGPEEGSGDIAQLASSDDGFSAATLRPRWIIDLSASIMQQEVELARALAISVFGDCLDGLASAILATIAGRFELQDSQLIIRRFGPASFLIILPDEDSATRVFNGGRPIIVPSHRLHVRRWTRFINSTAASLPFTVEMELRCIPAHAWYLATAESLLNDFCWIGEHSSRDGGSARRLLSTGLVFLSGSCPNGDRFGDHRRTRCWRRRPPDQAIPRLPGRGLGRST
jgi:hypothetical protein